MEMKIKNRESTGAEATRGARYLVIEIRPACDFISTVMSKRYTVTLNLQIGKI